MRKSFNDSLSRDTMLLMNIEKWSSDKDMIHRTRSGANTDSFVDVEKFAKAEHHLNTTGGFLITKKKRLLQRAMLNFL